MRKADDLTTFIVPKVLKIRSLNLPDPQGPVAGKLYLLLLVLEREGTSEGRRRTKWRTNLGRVGSVRLCHFATDLVQYMAVTEADNLLVVVVVVVVVVFIESVWTVAVCTSLGLADSFDLRSSKREDEKVAAAGTCLYE